MKRSSKEVVEKSQVAKPKASPQVASARGFKTIAKRHIFAVFMLGIGSIAALVSIAAMYLSLQAIQVTHTLRVPGVLQAIEQSTPVQHKRGGIIHDVLVTEGEVVREGQILASLQTKDVAEELRSARQTVAKHLLRTQCLRALQIGQDTLVLNQSLKTVMGRLQQVSEMQRGLSDCQSLLEKRKLARALDQSKLKSAQDVAALFSRLTQTDALMREKLGALENSPDLREEFEEMAGLRKVLENSIKSTQAKQNYANLIAEQKQSEMDRQQAIITELAEISDQMVLAQAELTRMEDILRDKFIYASISGRVQRMRIKESGRKVAAGAYVLEIAPLTTDFEVTSRITLAQFPSIAEGQPVQVQLSGGLPKPVWVPATVEKVLKVSDNKRVVSIRLKREDLNKRDLLLGDHSLNGLGERSEALISIKSENALHTFGTTLKNLWAHRTDSITLEI
ncbi:hypothetical protein GCM10007939_15640 [Amylibacter marinus]|uniref:HlyD family secretion protein n=1 Tax=Amylibacter marinus TaxID=1475483 RepID=A0ABQ5VV31_9RHOB|nr:HlyD family efflux transporter periplasmic adaptor subunit [Amylibacter marinus]GLQ35281.1 hypothetical protein GCM10007939_15640 [Amylibacter marinus]